MTELVYGVQVIKVQADHSYKLDETALEQILMRKEVKDLPVVVVSVAGAYRGGKSFLLNFFLRYLTSPQSARSNNTWLGAEGKPLTGFSWRGGSERNTTGILMWSEPIISTLPSGEKVAVLVMDTQGTFDNTSTLRDSSTIFALSTLISSVQIYNLSQNIKEDDLQHLQLFVEYGKLIRQESGKAFQVLEFLIRDWPFPWEHPFGAAGGKIFLEKKLEIKNEQPKELRELRQHIHSNFDRVTCFLMPHPGFGILTSTYKGDISVISPEFKQSLSELVVSIFDSANLIPKTMSGQRIKASELFTYFKTYLNIFNSDTIPTPVSILKFTPEVVNCMDLVETKTNFRAFAVVLVLKLTGSKEPVTKATSEASLLTAMMEAREKYNNEMERACSEAQPSMPTPALQELHRTALAAARAAFTNKKKIGPKADADKYLSLLTKELEGHLPQYMLSNTGKLQKAIGAANKAYEDYVRGVTKGQPLCLHPLDLERVQNEAVAAATRVFDANRKQLNKPDHERTTFIKNFENHYQTLQITNNQNNNMVVANVHAEYTACMENICARMPPVSGAVFKQQHEAALAKAIGDLKAKRNRSDSNADDVYKSALTRGIMNTFSRLESINISKLESYYRRSSSSSSSGRSCVII